MYHIDQLIFVPFFMNFLPFLFELSQIAVAFSFHVFFVEILQFLSFNRRYSQIRETWLPNRRINRCSSLHLRIRNSRPRNLRLLPLKNQISINTHKLQLVRCINYLPNYLINRSLRLFHHPFDHLSTLLCWKPLFRKLSYQFNLLLRFLNLTPYFHSCSIVNLAFRYITRDC